MIQLLTSQLIKIEEHRVSWKIGTFSHNPIYISGHDFRRMNFEIKTMSAESTVWCVSVSLDHQTVYDKDSLTPCYPKGIPKNVQCTWMHLSLLKKPDNFEEFNISLQVNIMNRDGEGIYNTCSETKFDILKRKDLKWSNIVIQDNDLQLPLTDDGSLVLQIIIGLHSPNISLEGLDYFVSNFGAKFTEKQQSDMESMFSGNTVCPKADSPTKVISKDGVEFPVNRGILSARSPVFLRVFKSDMTEGKTGIVRVKEIASGPLQVILRFLYTGQLSKNWSSPGIVEELVYSAGKYELGDLLEFFDKVLGLVCTQENAGKLMNLATKLNLKNAEKDLFKFIKQNATDFTEFQNFMEDAMCFDLGRMLTDQKPIAEKQ